MIVGGGPSGGATYRYNLTFSANFRNIFNDVNLAAPVGNITSPNIGRSIALIGSGPGFGGPFANGPAPRKIELQAQFTF